MSNAYYRTRIYERYRSTTGFTAGPDARILLFRRISKYLPSHDRPILELGAGSGAFLSFLQRNGFKHVRGVDGSEEQVEVARQAGVEVAHGDILSTLRSVADSSVGAVVALDVLEHFTKSEAFEVLEQIARVLDGEGRCVLHTVNAESPFFGGARYGDFTHETAFTESSMKQVLRAVGFSEVLCFEDRPIVHGAKSLARAAVWQVARSIASAALAAETGLLTSRRVLTQNFLTVAFK